MGSGAKKTRRGFITALTCGAVLMLATGGTTAAADVGDEDYSPTTPEGKAALSAGNPLSVVEEIDEHVPYIETARALDELLVDEAGIAALSANLATGELMVHARPDWSADVEHSFDTISANAEAIGVDVVLVDAPFGEDEFAAIWEKVAEEALSQGVLVSAPLEVGSMLEGVLGFAGPDLTQDVDAQAILSELSAQHGDGKLVAAFEDEEPSDIFFSDSRLNDNRS